MKKVLICGVIAAAFGMTSAFAAVGSSVGSQFDVKATVAATCQATNSGTQVMDFGTVSAFTTTAPTNKTVNITFKCTMGLAPAATLDATSGTVNGLAYSLSVPGTVSAATGGSAATGEVFSFPVTGSMGAGQAGDVNDANQKTHTLTIAF